MSDRIEEAAKIIREGIEDVRDEPHLSDAEHAKMVAEVLAKAGLLATHEEWGTRQEDEPEYVGVLPRFNKHTAEADINQYPEAGYTLHRRFVTEWEAVE